MAERVSWRGAWCVPASWGVGGGEFPAGAEECASVCLASFTSCMRCASPRRVSLCLASPPVDMPARCRGCPRGVEESVVWWVLVSCVSSCGGSCVVFAGSEELLSGLPAASSPCLALPPRLAASSSCCESLRVVVVPRLPRRASRRACRVASPRRRGGRGVEIMGAAARPVPSPSEFFPARRMGGGGCGLRACAPRACLPAASSACGFVSFG